MEDRRCHYCQQAFQPHLYHPQQQVQTTEIYTRVDPSVKLEALESVVPPKLRSGRFKATDKLIASLRAVTVMQSKTSPK